MNANVDDVAVVYDDKSGEIRLYYTGEREIPASEFDNILKEIQFPLCRFRYHHFPKN